MARLKSTLPLALLAAGCTGQTVTGRWVGPFPLEGSQACELRLQENRSATVQCDGTDIVGAGRYDWDGSRLNVELTVLTYRGKKVQPPKPFVFTVRGEGNAMRAERMDRAYEWRRVLR